MRVIVPEKKVYHPVRASSRRIPATASADSSRDAARRRYGRVLYSTHAPRSAVACRRVSTAC